METAYNNLKMEYQNFIAICHIETKATAEQISRLMDTVNNLIDIIGETKAENAKLRALLDKIKADATIVNK